MDNRISELLSKRRAVVLGIAALLLLCVVLAALAFLFPRIRDMVYDDIAEKSSASAGVGESLLINSADEEYSNENIYVVGVDWTGSMEFTIEDWQSYPSVDDSPVNPDEMLEQQGSDSDFYLFKIRVRNIDAVPDPTYVKPGKPADSFRFADVIKLQAEDEKIRLAYLHCDDEGVVVPPDRYILNPGEESVLYAGYFLSGAQLDKGPHFNIGISADLEKYTLEF